VRLLSTLFVQVLEAFSVLQNRRFVPCAGCIQVVHRGEIWANAEQIDYLVELVSQVPSLRVVNARGTSLLTPREEQVVAPVSEGLSNREVAQELGLSEHTIKKYLFRIFDKLGISTRVELVLYAVANGSQRAAEWLPAASE
jgi:two-component system, NarL family, response regulator DegU